MIIAHRQSYYFIFLTGLVLLATATVHADTTLPDSSGTGASNQNLVATSSANNDQTSATILYATSANSVIVTGGPVVVNQASSTPNPVTGKTATLSVLGNDAAGDGDSSLAYTWAVTSVPNNNAPPPIFSVNGTNSAKNTTATFFQAGTYGLLATITDPSGNTATSGLNILVAQSVSRMYVQPARQTITVGTSTQYSFLAWDQFSNPIVSPPVVWSLSGGGTISPSGLFTSTTGGTTTVTVAIGNYTATTTVYVIIPPTLITRAPVGVATSTLTMMGAITDTGGADATESGFAYGLSADLSTVIDTTALGSQIGTSSFSQGLTDLTPGTLYYFRAYAVNSAGTSTGAILSTTTLALSTPTTSPQESSGTTNTTASGYGFLTSSGGYYVPAPTSPTTPTTPAIPTIPTPNANVTPPVNPSEIPAITNLAPVAPVITEKAGAAPVQPPAEKSPLFDVVSGPAQSSQSNPLPFAILSIVSGILVSILVLSVIHKTRGI
jgi:hypothetical protein